MSTLENWAVVKFTEEETVEVIPTKWLINNDMCLWPANSYSKAKLTSAIRFQFNPEKDWKKCRVKCLCKTPINDFKLASKIANQATITSDLEAIVTKETSRGLPKKRSAPSKKKDILLSSEDDDYHDEFCLPKYKYPKPNIFNGNYRI